MKRLAVLLVILLSIALVWELSLRYIPQLRSFSENSLPSTTTSQTTILREENLVIDVVKNVGPSVITIGVRLDENSRSLSDPFSLFFGENPETEEENEIEYIGSGFVIDSEGLIVTNKHVVSDSNLQYVIVNENGESFDVEDIYRDPLNDLAILSVDGNDLKSVTLGDSENLQVGQYVIAIGTALGEFRNTVTTGVISGLGRGITAGSPYEGFVERLDDVIQTDAAISPGNSGGPLLNSNGQVIGVNTAVAASGQNIGFAIPINIVKQSLENFNQTGQFNRPYIGVAYRMLGERTAEANDVPPGAYVQEVIQNSPAEKAGIELGDIITTIDGRTLTDDNGGLAGAIANKKVGDQITVTYFRDGDTNEIRVTLASSEE
jgi:S1-C subfamily serine protease